MRNRTIPTSDAAFHEAQLVITAQALANAGPWQLDANWLNNSLNPAKALWETRWAAYRNPATRTPLATFEKTEARKAYESLLRVLVGNLEYNTKVTDDNRRAMGIAVRPQGRTPVPVPDTYPDFTVDTSLIRRLTIHFRDHNSERRAKPEGVSGAVIRWALLESVPAGVEALTNTVVDTASPCTLAFSESDRGRRVYLALAWQNTRGETGPWGEIGMAVIP